MLLVPSKGVMFLAIPKTGSMSVTSSLWGSFKGVTSFSWEEHSLMFDFNGGHSTLAEIKQEASKTGVDISEYCKIFTIVRNPFDRLVSYAAWRYPEEFAENSKNTLYKALWEDNVYTRPQSDYYAVGIKFLRFESLFVEYSTLAKEWGLEVAPLIPENESSREKDYRDYYDDTLRSIVEQKYAKDLELFNYTF